MVEDAITDPGRIAELLASELTGLETGPLAAVEVVDADRDATPSPDVTLAYAVAHDQDRIGRVLLYPDRAVVELDGVGNVPGDLPGADRESIAIERTTDVLALDVSTGAASKGAVDVLRAVLASQGPE